MVLKSNRLHKWIYGLVYTLGSPIIATNLYMLGTYFIKSTTLGVFTLLSVLPMLIGLIGMASVAGQVHSKAKSFYAPLNSQMSNSIESLMMKNRVRFLFYYE